ncbi:MAG: BamA/TamA family outer membrane protein [candidate division Zixibacteria bacterium]|nr:BamA/TamA family outer membrane protein [candidate division Zixibacteria bacterium]
MRKLLLLLLIAGHYPSFTEAQTVNRAFLRWMRSDPVIRKIVIEGNNYFEDSEIKKRLYSVERNFWQSVKGDRRSRVQAETQDRDTLEVKYLYLTSGFLNVEVNHVIEVIPEDSSARIRIQVKEGDFFRYGNVRITGNMQEELREEAAEIAERLVLGQPMNPLQMSQVSTDIKTVFANAGYPYAAIDIQLDTASSIPRSDVILAIEADSLVHFGEVEITGIQTYPSYTAERELVVQEGDIYKRDAILRSQRRLYESGYFTTLRLVQADSSTDRLNPDFDLRVRERKPRYITIKTGAGQSTVRDLEWDFSAGFGKRNFFSSRRYDVTAQYSFGLGEDSRLLTHRYLARYTEPWLLKLRIPITIGLEYSPPLRDEVRDFKVRLFGITLETKQRFGDYIRTTLGFEYAWVKFSDFSQSIDSINVRSSEPQRRKLYADLIRDSRDNLFLPRSGSVASLLSEYYGGFLGGDGTFVKIQTSLSGYKVVWPGWISASRARFGLARQFGSSDFVFSDEAQYIGGANSVRGFDENQLGPKDATGTPIGARYIINLNQEFRWKTVQVVRKVPLIGGLFEKLPLWQSIFFDIGNGFLTQWEIALKDLAYTYGTGFQLLTPAGPVRLDYARIIKSEKFDFADRWHFTILYAF